MALSQKQLRYCRERAKGKGYADAYADAGYCPNTSRDDQLHNAYTMENVRGHASEIKAKIKELTDLADQGAILNRRQRQAMLSRIALNEANDMPDRLRSIDQLNRMGGDYTDNVRTAVTGEVKLTLEEKLAAWEAAMGNEET